MFGRGVVLGVALGVGGAWVWRMLLADDEADEARDGARPGGTQSAAAAPPASSRPRPPPDRSSSGDDERTRRLELQLADHKAAAEVRVAQAQAAQAADRAALAQARALAQERAAQLIALQSASTHLSSVLDALRTDKAALESDNVALRLEMQQLKQGLDKGDCETDDARLQREQQADATAQRLRSEAVRLAAALDAAQAHGQQLAAELAAERERRDAQETRIAELQTAAADSRQAVLALERAHTQQRQQRAAEHQAALDAACAPLRAQLDAARQEIGGLAVVEEERERNEKKKRKRKEKEKKKRKEKERHVLIHVYFC